MSGGHFNYAFIRMLEFSEELQEEIDRNKIKDEWRDNVDVSDDGIELLKKAQLVFEEAAELAKAIEWCYSGDTGEEEMITALKASRLISADTTGKPL